MATTPQQEASVPGNDYILDEAAFDALEELLVSDAVPADCMNLEMLDGYLTAVLLAPQQISSSAWLPPIWSADADAAAFGSGQRLQKVVSLVLRYYNELATTVGKDPEWEPFCYAEQADSGFAVGEEWIDGFAQGLEIWPAAWEKPLAEADAERVSAALDAVLAPWITDTLTDEIRAARQDWLMRVKNAIQICREVWAAQSWAAPEPIEVPVAPSTSRSSATTGRNEACPCGSGKKFKKCCGAND